MTSTVVAVLAVVIAFGLPVVFFFGLIGVYALALAAHERYRARAR